MAEETKVEKEVTEEVEENKEAEAEVVEEEKLIKKIKLKFFKVKLINGKMIIIKCLQIWKTLKDVCKMNMQII